MEQLSTLFSIGAYLVQQLGILLGVGGEIVLLCAYLLHVHRDTRQSVVPAAETVQRVGLWCVVVSGLCAVAIHAAAGEWDVLLAPAFVFKWVLVVAVVVLSAIDERSQTLSPRAAATLRGVGGAQWCALLIVHTIAPVVPWSALLAVYAGWTAVYMLGWAAFVHVMMPGKPQPALVSRTPQPAPPVVMAAPAPAPKPAPVPAPGRTAAPAPRAPRVSAPLPVPAHAGLPKPPQPAVAPAPVHATPMPVPPPPMRVLAAPAPKPPTEFKEDVPAVPAIQVMPRTPQEVGAQNRGSIVQFS